MKYILLILFTFYFTQLALSAENIDFRLSQAYDVIEDTYGDSVYIKSKTLIKYGKNESVGTSWATVMTLPGTELSETYVSTNIIDSISSSSSSDTQILTIEGHKIVNNELIFVVQNVTLNGQNKVTLSTPLARSTRAYNTGSTDLAGTVYVYENQSITAGVPGTDTKVHLMIPTGENQSFKAATSLSSTDYWLLTEVVASINEKTAATSDIEIQVREFGKVFRTLFQFAVSSSGANTVHIPFDPVIIVPKNSDIRVRALASTSGVSVSANLNGYLAKVSD